MYFICDTWNGVNIFSITCKQDEFSSCMTWTWILNSVIISLAYLNIAIDDFLFSIKSSSKWHLKLLRESKGD